MNDSGPEVGELSPGEASCERREAEPLDRNKRDFLLAASRAGAIVPPAMVLLLSTTLSSPAIAASGGGRGCNRGRGNGPEGCDPGNSSGKGNTKRAGEGNGG